MSRPDNLIVIQQCLSDHAPAGVIRVHWYKVSYPYQSDVEEIEPYACTDNLLPEEVDYITKLRNYTYDAYWEQAGERVSIWSWHLDDFPDTRLDLKEDMEHLDWNTLKTLINDVDDSDISD